MYRGATLAVLSVLVMAGCSSIVEGTSQQVAINTNPPGANCGMEREGFLIARIDQTPGTTTIQKTKYDITIKCNLAGYHESTYFNKSGAAAATFGNIIAGGGIGWIVDSASGADNKYTSPVDITLVPLTEPAPAPQVSPSPGSPDKSERHASDSN